MKLPQYNLIELLLAVVFVGLFVALTARTWGEFFFVQGLVTAAVLLFATYLLLVLMIRRHRSPISPSFRPTPRRGKVQPGELSPDLPSRSPYRLVRSRPTDSSLQSRLVRV